MPNIKHPPVIDISHHIIVPDFRAIQPLPWLILTKATEGTDFRDDSYPTYARGIRAAGIRLGSYHFMLPGDEIEQAEWYCDYLFEVGLQGNEVLACDMEVGGVSLAEIKNFLDRVQNKTGIRPLIYSSQLILEGLYKGQPPPTWLLEEWLWIAEYPPAPDLTNEIPSWIVPRGCSANRIAFWQYSCDGILGGIPGNNVDLNLINPIFAAAIGLTEPQGELMPYSFSITPAGSSGSKYRPEPDTGNTAIGTLPYGKIAYGNKRLTIAEDKFEGGIQVNKSGDLWLEVLEVNGVVLERPAYIAEIHLGVRYATIRQLAPTPAPDPTLPDLPVSITLGDDVTYAKQTVNIILKPK